MHISIYITKVQRHLNHNQENQILIIGKVHTQMQIRHYKKRKKIISPHQKGLIYLNLNIMTITKHFIIQKT